MKQKAIAEVISQAEIAPGIFDLWLNTELSQYAHAGQFVGVYPKSKAHLLPRPISICEISDDRTALRLVYRVAGAGTAEFADLIKGDSVNILGILGNGYEFDRIFGSDISENTNVVLMGGGIGIPPMLELAKELKAHNIEATVIAGYRDSNLFLNQDLAEYGRLEIATEDGSIGTKGNVLNVVDNLKLRADVILACGPMPMLRAIKRYAETQETNGHSIKVYISLEERMACGVGACLGCICKTKSVDHHSNVKNARICTDGPVFDAFDVDI